ncbi:Transcription factor Adf-1 [Merluccius polli]|uniref:Transcription factor Adf-1 n=1 Tax=Merluccius polli TaxID=89951 RepID=A0AA47MN36_MERPO|nr:Transcription factor Adf-1 [Merluccius polli]
MSTEKLIAAVAGHPVLYDPSLFCFRDRNKKALAWAEVSRVVGWSVNECIKKWKSLRDTYRKNKKKEKERRRSGAGAGGGKPWKYAGIMAFIDPFMDDRESQTNMGEPGPVSESECESEDTEQAASGRAPVVDQEESGRAPVEDQEEPGRAPVEQMPPAQAEEQAAGHSRPKKGRGQTRSLDVEERLLTAIEAVSNRVGQSPPPEDSDSLFFRSLQEDFKLLSHRTRQDLKFQMYRMVYEAKCREVDPWGEGNGAQLTTL